MGRKLLLQAADPREQAFACGYLSHLAADIIAHNIYVPNQLYLTSSTIRWGHIYWELRADEFTDQKYWKQVLEVIQPDLCVTGGITEGKKICDMAHVYDVAVQCHCCGSPITQAAALHVESTIPNFIIHEHVYSAGTPENRELMTPDLKPVNGSFTVPEGPGLGLELNEKVIAKYPRMTVN